MIKAPAGSKAICINGAAAHLIKPHDTIIVLSYCLVEKNEEHTPVIVKVNNQNEIID